MALHTNEKASLDFASLATDFSDRFFSTEKILIL